MPCGWEGNRRSGVALAMRNRLQWSIEQRAHGVDREMSLHSSLGIEHFTFARSAESEARAIAISRLGESWRRWSNRRQGGITCVEVPRKRDKR